MLPLQRVQVRSVVKKCKKNALKSVSWGTVILNDYVAIFPLCVHFYRCV